MFSSGKTLCQRSRLSLKICVLEHEPIRLESSVVPDLPHPTRKTILSGFFLLNKLIMN